MSRGNIKENTVYSIVKSLSAVIFPLITFPYISRILQPENVGKINFSGTIVGYFSLIASLGVTTYAVRECSKVKGDKKKLSDVSSQIFSINIVMSVISYFLLGVTLLGFNHLNSYRALIIIQSTTIFFSVIGADWVNTAMEDFRYITIRMVMFQVLSLFLMFLLVRHPDDYIKYALISVLSTNGANIINVFYRRKYCHVCFTLKIDIKKHLPPIIGLFAMLIAQQVFTMADTTIIGLCLGDYEVGIYSAALKIYNIVNSLITSITWVVLPQLSLYYSSGDYHEVRRILKYAIQFTAILGIPCCIGIFMLSPQIIMIVAGEAYMGAVPVLRVLSLTLAASLAGNFVLNINILALGKDKVALVACVLASVVNVIMNLVFVPAYGVVAAAITTVASQILIVLVCIPFIDKDVRVYSLLKYIIHPLIASTGLIILVEVICNIFSNEWICLISSAILGALIYGITLIILKNDFLFDVLNSICLTLKKLFKTSRK